MHGLQLLRDVALINEQVRRELGPMRYPRGHDALDRKEQEGKSAVDIRTISSASALGVLVAGGAAASTARANPASSEAPVSGRFRPYASVRLGGGATCVVGATSDDDGMNQRPYVITSDGAVELWSRDLSIPSEYYGGRATHCLRHGGLSMSLFKWIRNRSRAFPKPCWRWFG